MAQSNDKVYGRRPALSKDYPAMMKEVTMAQKEAEGYVFDHSDLKKPYRSKDYEDMERMFSPANISSYKNPSIPNPDIPDFPPFEPYYCVCKCGSPALVQDVYCDMGAGLFVSTVPQTCGDLQVSDGSLSLIGKNYATSYYKDPKCTGDIIDCLMYQYYYTPDCEGGTWENWGATYQRKLVTAKNCCGQSTFYVYKVACSGTPVISGADGVTKPGSYQYTQSGAEGDIAWSVTGTGASISDTGLVTLSSSACGAFTITATCGSNSGTFSGRVTNAGSWGSQYDCYNTIECDAGSISTCVTIAISGIHRTDWHIDLPPYVDCGCVYSTCAGHPPFVIPGNPCSCKPPDYGAIKVNFYRNYTWQC